MCDSPRGLPGWPGASDPDTVSRDEGLAHRPWLGNIPFNRCMDGPGVGLGTSATRLPCAFWANHFHPHLYQRGQFDTSIPGVPRPVTLFIMTSGRGQEWQGKKDEVSIPARGRDIGPANQAKLHSAYQRLEQKQESAKFEEFLDLLECSCQTKTLSPFKMQKICSLRLVFNHFLFLPRHYRQRWRQGSLRR